MENEKHNKLGGGIITLSVIDLIIRGFGLLGFIFMLAFKDVMDTALKQQYDAMGMTAPTLTKSSLIVGMVVSALLVLGMIFILCKKSLGVYMYFITYVIFVISDIVMSGFKGGIIINLLFVGLYGFFIYKKKHLFGFGTDDNESASM